MRARRVGVLAGALLLAAAAACEQPPAPLPESYRVRAQVRQVPAPDAARGEIFVRHEAIQDFKDAGGEVVGMESMSMSFPLADVALAAGVEAGDRIEMSFEVDWRGGNPLRVTTIEILPEDTRLAFEAPEPNAPEPDAGADPP